MLIAQLKAEYVTHLMGWQDAWEPRHTLEGEQGIHMP